MFLGCCIGYCYFTVVLASGFAVLAVMRMHCFIRIPVQVKIFLVIYPNGFYYKIVVGK